MVSTRHHRKEYPEPSLSPSASPSKSSTTSPSKATSQSLSTTTPKSSPPTKRSTPSSSSSSYTHHPNPLITTWLLLSLPLIFWDTGYVLLRPHTMPGGRFHNPIWTPYALYGSIDYMYGWPAWNAGNGFTAAQGTLNLVESVLYIWYLGVVWGYGTVNGEEKKGLRWLAVGEKSVGGGAAGMAVVVAFAAAVMTLSKTVLYWLNEAFSGFDNIGHNDAVTLVTMWVIPNGAWLVGPGYMIYALGREIVEAMDHGGGGGEERKER